MMVFDTESDGLLHGKWDTDEDGNRVWSPPATKFHIFGWTLDGETYKSTTDSDLFLEVIDKENYSGCHNAFSHDFPMLKKLLDYEYKGLPIDTLYLSWYLFPKMPKHGLEEWGEVLGYPKVKVDKEEWKNPDMNLMKQRVERDVEINWKLWMKQKKVLEELYNGN